MSYFEESLSNLTTQVAYKDAIERLYEKGLSESEIIKQCLYPVNETIVKNVINDYKMLKEKPKSKFIEEYDAYGRKTFRKV